MIHTLGRPAVRRTAAAALAAGLSSTGLVAATLSPAQAAPSRTLTDFAFQASSYGSDTKGNDAADSDPTALSFIGCTRYVPRTHSNYVSEAGDPNGASVNEVRTRNLTRRKDGRVWVTSVVRIERGTMAEGAVTFENLTGRVKSFHGARGYATNTRSSLGSLKIFGVEQDTGDGERTRLDVPGYGKLVLHRQVQRERALSATGGVNVIRFVGDDGTIEKTGRAYARIDGETSGGVFRGAAWGSDAETGDVASSGRGALQPMPCPGTRGEVLESSTGRSNTDFAVFGTRRSYVEGRQRDNGSATGYTRSVVESAAFGEGALRFRNVKAQANVTRQADGDVLRNARGTGVGKVFVNGEEVNPRAGEENRVAGLGTYKVREVNKSRNGIDVTGVIVRLFNGTPRDKSDDTVVNLARARLKISRG